VDIESFEKQAIEFIHRGYPFLLRFVVIFILVESSIGFLFFFMALFYRVADSDFLLEIKYKGLSGNSFLWFLTLLALLHAGLMLSSILMLRKKIKGFYLYLITLPILIVISFYSENEISYLAPILGLFSFFIIFINRKSLS
jgi:hypothetical protein